nr:hypothetical protein [Tanacetum cinerariifolium]
MEQELRLKREAAERAFKAQAEKDRTLMRLEELRFLATSTKDLDDDDAYWIKKQKRLIKNKMRNDLGDEDDEDEILEMSLDDCLVLLMADADVIKSLSYVLSGKDSRLFMLEWSKMGKDDEHVDISNHAPTYDVCPIVGPRNDENVENLDCDNDVPMTNPFSFRNMIEDSDVDVMRMLVVYTNSWLVIFMINYGLLVRFIRKRRRHLLMVICSNKIVLWTANRNLFRLLMNNKRLPEMFAQLNHPGEEVFFQTIDAQVVPTHDVAEKVDANLDQSKMFAVRLWQEFGPDVIDFVKLYSGDEKMMSMLHNLEKESCGRLEENMRARKTL